MNIKYRQIRKEDSYEWYSLLDEVWRVTYSHIFPKEVFDGLYFIDFLLVLFL